MEDNGNKEDDWIRKAVQYMKESKEQINEKGISLFTETEEDTGCKENLERCRKTQELNNGKEARRKEQKETKEDRNR